MKNNCRYSLDKKWKFTEEKCSVCPEILSHEMVYGFAKTGGIGGVVSDGYDDGKWEDVDLPHDWQHAAEYDLTAAADHGYKRGGVCWYRRKFLLDEKDQNKAISILFDGIGGKSVIYLNGTKVAENGSRYNSFCVNITDFVHFGLVPNVLTIEVDSRQWEGWWYEGSGIYRHVWLLKEPAVHVKNNGVFILPEYDEICDLWHTSIQISLKNDLGENTKFTVSTEIQDSSGNKISERDEAKGILNGFCEQEEKFKLDVKKPKLWDIENPELYYLCVKVKAEEDRQELRLPFGYRTIKVDPDTGFWLNGKNIKILGTCNHQDHACVGAAVPDALAEYRIRILKEMGCNAYRCAHHNPSPELLDICDREGVLVLDENRSFNSSEQGMAYLKDMVFRDRNHPCVIMYALFNEEPLQGTPKGRRIAKRMVSRLKEWDGTRPVIGAFNGGYMEKAGAADVFDVTGINYFVDDYDKFHQEFPKQPVISTELVSAYSTRDTYVTDSDAQVFDNYDQNKAMWGETVREANYAVLSRRFVMGMFVWTGFDYHGEPSPYEWPGVSSHFGAIDMCGYPKDAYYLYQAFWKKDKVLHLLPHWNHKKGDKVKVMTYSNCDEVELFVNGLSRGRKKNNIYEQCSWTVDYEEGVIEAAGYSKDGSVIWDRQRTAGKAKALHVLKSSDIAYHDSKDAVILDIIAVDHNCGRAVEADDVVTVRVEGGRLLGMGNGDPNCHAAEKGAKYPLFHGRCQAVIRAGDTDEIKVFVSGEKLEEVNFALPVRERKTEEEVPQVQSQVVRNWKVSHRIWKEKPDPKMQIEKSDMNTFEPIEFNGAPLFQLRGKKDMYSMYRAQVKLPDHSGSYYLRFSRYAGRAEVYWNGNMIGEKDSSMPDELCIEFSEKENFDGSLTVILQNTSTDACSGILAPVEITGKK